jgi:hypothetical protein
MTNSASTPAQRRLLNALIDAGGAGYPSELGRLATVRVCRANGWIEQLPAEPFTVPQYSITTAGRAIVERKPRPAAERAKIAQEARSANAQGRRLEAAAVLLREAGWTVTHDHERCITPDGVLPGCPDFGETVGAHGERDHVWTINADGDRECACGDFRAVDYEA